MYTVEEFFYCCSFVIGFARHAAGSFFFTYNCMVVIRFYHCRHNKDCFSPEQLARHSLQTQKSFIHSQLIYGRGWIIQDNVLWLIIIKVIALRDCKASLEIINLSIVYYFFFVCLSPNCVSLPCTWFTLSMSWTKVIQTLKNPHISSINTTHHMHWKFTKVFINVWRYI